MQDYYKILGVDRQASPDAIKRAYRKLASLYHPDKEGGSKTKFQELQAAYDTLSDPVKRQQYDNPSPFGGQGGFHGFGRHETPFDMDAIFNMFGARFHHPHQVRRAQMQLWITLADIVQGGRRTISVGTQQGAHAVEIEIPVGIEDGDSVQYPGVGPGGMDLIITFRIHPNPKWARNGVNLITEETVSVWDLILGAEITIRDILGNNILLTIPAGTQPGTVLRLRGRGMSARSVEAGDILVKMQARIPDTIPAELLELIEQNRNQ